jgi:hypothetical protein
MNTQTQTRTDTATLRVEHIQPGMVMDFQMFPGVAGTGDEAVTVEVAEAEVISVETPDGLSDDYGLWVSPEDGSHPEVYVSVRGWQSFGIAG